MVLSIIYYYFPVYGGKHWFTGPIRTVEEEKEKEKEKERTTGKVYDDASQRESITDSGEEKEEMKRDGARQNVVNAP